MFDLRVTGYDEAIRLSRDGWPTHVICATATLLPIYGRINVKHVAMDDVLRPSPGVIVPTPEHVRTVLDFTQNLTSNDRLLVHCRLGLNRSPALAIAVLLQHGMTVTEAYHKVANLRPHMAPNRLLIAYVDRQFALDGELNRLLSSGFRTQRAFVRS